MNWNGVDILDKTWQAVEKRTSAALHSFLYCGVLKVRLIPHNFVRLASARF